MCCILYHGLTTPLKNDPSPISTLSHTDHVIPLLNEQDDTHLLYNLQSLHLLNISTSLGNLMPRFPLVLNSDIDPSLSIHLSLQSVFPLLVDPNS